MRPALDVLRLFLHVGSAIVWLGGMVTLAGIAPTLRAIDPDGPGRATAAFARFAWPAYGILLAPGVRTPRPFPALRPLAIGYQIALSLKILLAVASGLGAFIAQSPNAPRAAVPAAQALATLGAAGALLIGVGLLG